MEVTLTRLQKKIIKRLTRTVPIEGVTTIDISDLYKKYSEQKTLAAWNELADMNFIGSGGITKTKMNVDVLPPAYSYLERRRKITLRSLVMPVTIFLVTTIINLILTGLGVPNFIISLFK